MLLDSNPHLLVLKHSTIHQAIGEFWIVWFRLVILQQSKAHFLRRFTKTDRKVIEYSYVSGQFWQTISLSARSRIIVWFTKIGSRLPLAKKSLFFNTGAEKVTVNCSLFGKSTFENDIRYICIQYTIAKSGTRRISKGLYSPCSIRVGWRNRLTVRSMKETPIFVQSGA